MKKNKNILIIDDSFTNNVLIEAILEGEGYKIDKAYTVTEALKVIKAKKIELILLDLIMPKRNGYDFLRSVKKNEKTKDIPVMIVSAVTDPGKINKTYDLGAIDYVSKPINIENFVDKVNNMLLSKVMN